MNKTCLGLCFCCFSVVAVAASPDWTTLQIETTAALEDRQALM